MKYPEEWTKITDPEMCWLAMIAAKTGVILSPMLQLRAWEIGGIELFDMKTLKCVLTSLAGYVKGKRFVVVWNPRGTVEAPEVFHDTRHKVKA